ncbi:MAG: hypothetical protein PHT78_02250, partial [Desulfitobacteriaceae bacterium]|nr:hypothetical protein [Desulfitobacteriaceae bacterium]
WAVEVLNPIGQIDTNGTIRYSDFKDPYSLGIELPNEWKQGFYVRIIGHRHFKTQHTQFKLNHKCIRDYSKWFTVFGTIRTLFDNDLKNRNIKLYLNGLNMTSFKNEFSGKKAIDPIPIFETIDNNEYEVISFGHYFPEQRYTDTKMKAYAKKISSNKAYYEFYSRNFKEVVACSNNINFNFVISIEGYETKRRYDILLTRRGRKRSDITHTDSERYGLWACKSGIPVQKIDDWIEGGKGTYSFIQAFIDCDDLELTANRGSINNSNIEIIEILKRKVNDIFSSKKILDAIKERTEIEKMENTLSSIDEDERNLKERFRSVKKRKSIILPTGVILMEPTKRKVGYSESETLVLLVNIIAQYPNLFPFKLLDYDTTKGIDFVIEYQGAPKYIELKGTLHKKINHPFRHIYKFVCYDIEVSENDIVTDIEDFETLVKINNNDKFASFDNNFKNKVYTSYKLAPSSATINDMEIISLRSILTEVIGAKIQ